MHNRGYYTASLCEIVRWLGERAEELGVNLFAGFPVDSLLVEGDAVRGVRTTPAGPRSRRRARLGLHAAHRPRRADHRPRRGTRGLLGQA